MTNDPQPHTDPDEPAIYRIRIAGHLGGQWSEWFEGMAITLDDDGTTLLCGPVPDQAALHGLFRKVRDVGMPLLSVVRVTAGQPDQKGPPLENTISGH